jgi:hypothetical protein
MRGVSHGLAVFAVLCGLMAPCGFEASAQSSGTTKADTTKKTQPKPTTTKAPAKPPAQAPSKPTTTTSKPATTKTTAPTSTTAKPAPSGTSTRAGGATGGAAPRTSSAGAARKAAPEAYSTVGVYAGGATAGLGFGAGPSGGLVWRRKSARLPLDPACGCLGLAIHPTASHRVWRGAGRRLAAACGRIAWAGVGVRARANGAAVPLGEWGCFSLSGQRAGWHQQYASKRGIRLNHRRRTGGRRGRPTWATTLSGSPPGDGR